MPPFTMMASRPGFGRGCEGAPDQLRLVADDPVTGEHVARRRERGLQIGPARVLGLPPRVGGGDHVHPDRAGSGSAVLLVPQANLRQSSGAFGAVISMSLAVAAMASSTALRSGASGERER